MRFLQCFAASSIHLRSSRRRARVQSLVQLWKAACKVQNAIAKSELRTFTFFSTDLQYLSLMQFAVCLSSFSWCNVFLSLAIRLFTCPGISLISSPVYKWVWHWAPAQGEDSDQETPWLWYSLAPKLQMLENAKVGKLLKTADSSKTQSPKVFVIVFVFLILLVLVALAKCH